VLSSRDASGGLPQPHAQPAAVLSYIVAVLRFLAPEPGGLSTLQWGYWADHPLRGDLTAIAVAQQQNARSFALRAALSLAKLYRATGRDADARAALRPAGGLFWWAFGGPVWWPALGNVDREDADGFYGAADPAGAGRRLFGAARLLPPDLKDEVSRPTGDASRVFRIWRRPNGRCIEVMAASRGAPGPFASYAAVRTDTFMTSSGAGPFIRTRGEKPARRHLLWRSCLPRELAHDLSNGRLSLNTPCHLDLDLNPLALAPLTLEIRQGLRCLESP
jgi:hypothetical protein